MTFNKGTETRTRSTALEGRFQKIKWKARTQFENIKMVLVVTQSG